MKKQSMFTVERWNKVSRTSVTIGLLISLLLMVTPFFASGLVVDKLTTLFVYLMIAMMWNLLAGFAGLVSVGQQAFIGLGAYFSLRLVEFGMSPYLALVLSAVVVALVAYAMSFFVLELKGGEFAIALWVIAEVIRSLVMLDPLVQGETGTSLLAMNAYAPELRRNLNFWLGLGGVVGMVVAILWLLNSRYGAAAQAIRDDEEAADSVGIRVKTIKRLIFVVAAVGCALAGSVWLASSITFIPRMNFGIQWTVFMLFMVLVGGLGTFEGPILGAIVFFLLQEIFGDLGVWYLAGLGVVAVVFALYLPKGIWGEIQHRKNIQLLPTGVRLVNKIESKENT